MNFAGSDNWHFYRSWIFYVIEFKRFYLGLKSRLAATYITCRPLERHAVDGGVNPTEALSFENELFRLWHE